MESNLKIEEERIETISNRVIRTFQKRSDFIPSLKIKFFIGKSNRLAESNSKERRIETISVRYISQRFIHIYIYVHARKVARNMVSKKGREREEKYSGANIRRGNLSKAIRSSETDKC